MSRPPRVAVRTAVTHPRAAARALLPWLVAANLAGCTTSFTVLTSRDGGPADGARPESGPGDAGLAVQLVAQAGVSGVQRVNFAVPLAPGQLRDAARVRVLQGTTELRAARRALARYADGSVRSVQLQVDVALPTAALDVRVDDAATTPDATLVPVADTLVAADASRGPRVWAVLPARWLADSGVAGPLLPEADVAGPAAAWGRICDYDAYGTDAFLPIASDPGPWLFDRGAALYRGYARRGALSPLQSAYLETALYRNGLTGTGAATRNGVPTRADDVRYMYSQNMAIHYLLTGDDRFRESAEDAALGAANLRPAPGYAGGDDAWTEQDAGALLLAYVWAMIVTDDRADAFRRLADDAVAAYLAVQATYPAGYTDRVARCFAHSAAAHGEAYGYFGCSPWMSAILADGLDAYATERGGAQATQARDALVQLGRILARQGRDDAGKPYQWLGVGVTTNQVDPDNEHWGESAYVIAMAWYHAGRTDTALRRAADELVAGFGAHGVAPHVRSFTWQCRSAVATAWYLR